MDTPCNTDLMGNDVTKTRYDQFAMRRHVIGCLENGVMTRFPKKRCDVKPNQGTEIPRRPARVYRRREEEEVITLNNNFAALDTTPEAIGVWQVVAKDCLKFHAGTCPKLLWSAGGPYGVSGLACLQVKRPAAVFYHFAHPKPYAYEEEKVRRGEKRKTKKEKSPKR
jgi:hypothetical protein